MAGMSEQQRRFADFVLEGKSATEAYKLAGYKPKNDDVAAAAASRLLGNVKVSRYIAERQQKAVERVEITRELLIQEGWETYKHMKKKGSDSAAGTFFKEVGVLTGHRVEKNETEIITHEDRLAAARERIAERQQPTRH